MLEQDRAIRARAWRRNIGVLGLVVAVAVTTWGVDPVWAQATFCPNDPALASQINGNFQGVAGWITGKAGPLASPDIATRDISARNVALTGPVSFGATGGQMLNLFQTGYGADVQTSTLYNRTSGNFAWYLNGAHANNAFDPGGG